MRSEPTDMRDPSPPDGAWQATAQHGACSPTTPADIPTGSRQRRRAWMQVHVSVSPLTANQPLAGAWRDRRRGRLVGRRPTTRPDQA